ncbi:hypothetical protein J4Q44_G00016280 [Coregonus suidteri]|uniref:Uncharacterized protein n=1 Tax=Coregonus suidteri TaxID=861788 RepID=A0AAN8R7A2_9TELE
MSSSCQHIITTGNVACRYMPRHQARKIFLMKCEMEPRSQAKTQESNKVFHFSDRISSSGDHPPQLQPLLPHSLQDWSACIQQALDKRLPQGQHLQSSLKKAIVLNWV